MPRRRSLVRVVVAAAVVVTLGCARQNRGLGDISRRDLPEPETVQDVPCRDFAVFHENGKLLTCKLDRDAMLGVARLPAGTTVRFLPDGGLEYVFLPQDTRIAGHLCKGSGSSGAMTSFYPGGELRVCWLAEDETIQDVPCVRSTTRREIFGRLAGRGGPAAVFHRSGRLQSCMLSEGFEHAGRSYKKGTRIVLEDGDTSVPNGRARTD